MHEFQAYLDNNVYGEFTGPTILASRPSVKFYLVSTTLTCSGHTKMYKEKVREEEKRKKRDKNTREWKRTERKCLWVETFVWASLSSLPNAGIYSNWKRTAKSKRGTKKWRNGRLVAISKAFYACYVMYLHTRYNSDQGYQIIYTFSHFRTRVYIDI